MTSISTIISGKASWLMPRSVCAGTVAPAKASPEHLRPIETVAHVGHVDRHLDPRPFRLDPFAAKARLILS